MKPKHKGVWLAVSTIFSFSLTTMFSHLEASAQRLPNGVYQCRIHENGSLLKEFLVDLKSSGDTYNLTSEIKENISLSPVNGTREWQFLEISQTKGSSNRFLVPTNAANAMVFEDGKGFRLEILPDVDVSPLQPVRDWHSPFHGANDLDFPNFKKRIFSPFGAVRTSPQKGHLHAGIDLAGDWNEPVYAVAEGEVVFLSYWDLNAVIIIKHQLEDGDVVYSKSIHLKDISVRLRQKVNDQTLLGRLFNQVEFKKSRFPKNHFHLEIRKDYMDKGSASSHSMTRKALETHCYDPEQFFKTRL